MSWNREKEALDLLTHTSLLHHQLRLQPNGQKQLSEEFDNSLQEQHRYCVRALEVNLAFV